MRCDQCKYFDKEFEACSLKPSEMTETICVLRNILIAMNIMIQEDMEGEEWKL